MESNHHGVAPASPSSWCVYQFRHHRKQSTQNNVYVHMSNSCLSCSTKMTYLTQPTGFIKCKYYFFCAGATGAAGAAGAGVVAGAAPLFCETGAETGAAAGA